MTRNAVLRVSKNTSVLFIGTVCKMLFSFAFIIYVARFLGVESFGKYALAQRYFELFFSLSATGLSILITREIAKKKSHLNQYLSASVLLVMVLSIVAGAILIIISRLFGYASDTQAAIIVASVAILPATICLLFEAVFVAFETAEYVTYGTVFESILNTGLGLIVLFFGYRLLALFVVLIVSRICMLIFYFILLNRQISKLQWNFDRAFFRKLVRDWKIFAFENWLSNIYGNLGVIVLSIFHGEVAVGLYLAAGKILRLGVIASASYTNAIFPYLSRVYIKSKDIFDDVSERSLKYMLALVLPSIIVIAIFADRVITLLYTYEYALSIPILRVLIWSLLLKFLNQFIGHTLFARGDQFKSLQVAAIRLIFYAILCFWLIPIWGGIGAAWAQLLGSCAAFCLYYYVFTLRTERWIGPLLMLGRTTLAAISLGVFLLVLRNYQLIPLILAGAVLYILLLLFLRVFSSNDLKLLQKLK